MDISASLQSSMDSFHTHTFTPFLTRHTQDLQHAEQEYDESLEAFASDCQQAQLEKERLSGVISTQKEEQAIESAKVKEAENVVATLKTQAAVVLPSKLTNLKQTVAVNEGLTQSLKNEVDALTSIHIREIDAVTRGVRFFAQRLGVRFEVAEGKLRIVFQFISEPHPNEEYEARIFVDENRMYQLSMTSPAAAMDAVEKLIQQLNATNNFAQFIVQTRKCFVQYAKEKDEKNEERM